MRIRNTGRLLTHGNVEGRRAAIQILEKGLEAVDPYYNTGKIIEVKSDLLYIGNDEFVPEGSPRKGIDCYRLGKDVQRIFVFGAGKGIQRIAQALEDKLGSWLNGGLVILKQNDNYDLKHINVRRASHPVPSISCLEASKDFVKAICDAHLTKNDLVFTIIGNGASSLLTYPWDEISLDDVCEVTQILQIEKGLSTPKLNIVRNQLDRLKGGRLSRLLRPAKMVHLIPIDLNEPNAFGVGGYKGYTQKNFWLHTLPDISTPEKAIEVLKENDVWERVGSSIRNYLNCVPAGREVLSTEEFESTMDCRIFGLMSENCNFISKTMEASKSLGFEPYFLMKRTFVDAATTGVLISNIAKNVEDENMPFKAPCMILMTGEMLVAVNGKNGVGGRNQEFAVQVAKMIRNSKRIISVSVDTDGTDGPGGFINEEAQKAGCQCLAGGLVDGYTFDESKKKSLDLAEALDSHATSSFLWDVDCGIWTTPSISVQDLIFMLIMDHDGKYEND